MFVYLLWIAGFLFGVLAVVEIGFVVYKVYKKNEKIHWHVVLFVLFFCLSVCSISSAFFILAKNIASSNVNYREVVKDIGRFSGELASDAVKGFEEGIENTPLSE